MIFSIAYRSIPAIAAEAREREIRAILKTARVRNAALDITGGLLVADGHFIQVLEGDSAEVTHLVEAIARDPRHTDFTIFFREFRDQRRFAGWAMAWIGAGMDGIMALPFADPASVPAWLELLAERAGN